MVKPNLAFEEVCPPVVPTKGRWYRQAKSPRAQLLRKNELPVVPVFGRWYRPGRWYRRNPGGTDISKSRKTMGACSETIGGTDGPSVVPTDDGVSLEHNSSIQTPN